MVKIYKLKRASGKIMAAQFILGKSGTGKTRMIFDQIISQLDRTDDNSPLILLLPEQATYQAERAILSDPRIKGYSRLHVLSFGRLAFMLVGRYCQSRLISKSAGQMIISKILRDCKDDLKVFHLSAASRGLAENVTAIIAEMVNYCHALEDIDALIAKLQKSGKPQSVINKFRDLKLIYTRYLDFLAQRQYLDPDYQLTDVLKKIPDADFIKGASLWVDGFSDFSSQEFAVLYQLIQHSRQTKISLCLDPAMLNLPPDFELTSIFFPTVKTFRKLSDTISDQLKIKIDKPVILKENFRFKNSPSLEHIEANIFQDKPTKIDSQSKIKIVTAGDQRAEIEFTAREICNLVRKENYRYRDIALIVSGLDQYHQFVQAVFKDYEIPYFIDTQNSLKHHPLSEFITSSLNIVINGFNSREVFSYLKSGFANVDFENVSLFENYCLACGISPQHWQDSGPWKTNIENSFDLKFINDFRSRSVKELLNLREKLNHELTADEFGRSLIEFLNCHNICDKLTNSKDTQLSGHLINQITGLLEEMVSVYADDKLPASELAQTFLDSFAQLKFTQIPPTLDQVLVGSIERSRHPEIKAAFLIGATQKHFPVPVSPHTVLNEAERQIALKEDFELSSTLRQNLLSRQYLAYIAFTRPSEKLFITSPASDEKGAAIVRSYFLTSLESLFTDDMNVVEQGPLQPENILTANGLYDYLCLNAGKDSPDIVAGKTLLKQIAKENDFKKYFEFASYAIDHSNEPKLDSNFVNQFYGSRLSSSVSKLQTFAGCPFRYFAQYVLKVKPKMVMRLKPADMGSFYHEVIDLLSKKMIEQNESFKTIDCRKLDQLLEDSIEKYLSESSFMSSFSTHSAHNTFIIDSAAEMLEQFLHGLCQLAKVSSFDLHGSELSFGFDQSKESFELDIDGKMTLKLRGRIDRLDICQHDGQKLGLIIDYKTSNKNISWTHAFNGLDIQLPVYLLAGKYSKKFTPAGAFYMPIEAKILDENGKFPFKLQGIFNGEFARHLDCETVSNHSPYFNFCITKNDLQYGRYSTSGALQDDHFDSFLKFTENKIKSLARQIASGNIAISPYRLNGSSPCMYCDHKSLCRFDWQINKYNFLEATGKMSFLESIQ